MTCLENIPELHSLIDNEFYRLRQATYRDSDGLTKISIGIALLQNHSAPRVNVEREIVEMLYGEIKRRNLDLVVNDLVVNLLQVRNGEIDSLL